MRIGNPSVAVSGSPVGRDTLWASTDQSRLTSLPVHMPGDTPLRLHWGPAFGVAGTARRIAYDGAALFTVHHGRVASVWVLGDLDALRRQLTN